MSGWKTLDLESMLREAGGGGAVGGAGGGTTSANAGGYAVPLGAPGRAPVGAQDAYAKRKKRKDEVDVDYYRGYESIESYQGGGADWMLPTKV
jgi:hypothetical protein